MPNDIAFSYRTARSPAIASAIGAVVAIESIAVHFAVAARHPRVVLKLDDPETFLRSLEQHRAALSARPA